MKEWVSELKRNPLFRLVFNLTLISLAGAALASVPMGIDALLQKRMVN